MVLSTLPPLRTLDFFSNVQLSSLNVSKVFIRLSVCLITNHVEEFPYIFWHMYVHF